MPSKDPIQRFEDILENVALIEEFTAGMDLAAFTEDLKTSNAAERCLERISEAAKTRWRCRGAVPRHSVATTARDRKSPSDTNMTESISFACGSRLNNLAPLTFISRSQILRYRKSAACRFAIFERMATSSSLAGI